MSESHRELVYRACHWLQKTRRCKFVLCECSSQLYSEIPDALGFDGRAHSISVECKVTKSDFYADRRKSCGDKRVGWLRYFMCPPGVLLPSDMPPGIGLLHAGRVVRVVVKAQPREQRNLEGEIMIVVAEMSRVVEGLRNARDSVGLFFRDDREIADSLRSYRTWLDERYRGRSEQQKEAPEGQAQDKA